MSKEAPWLDIVQSADWDECVVQYQKNKQFLPKDLSLKGLMTSAFKFGKRSPDHNDFLTLIGYAIKNYHGVVKADVTALDMRAGMLEALARNVEEYMKTQGVTREMSTSTARTKAHALTQEQKDLNQKYKSKDSIAYLLFKLARRAKRKAAYIRELKKHTDNHAKGFQGYDGLMAYLRRDRERNDDLVALRGDVLMERLDPWHRVFEMKLDARNTIGASYMDGALKMWMYNTQAHDIPFFVWLEGNFVCTGVDTDGTTKLLYADGVDLRVRRGVTYLNEGTSLPLLVCISGGHAYVAMCPEGTKDLPLMEKCPSPSKEPGAYAYVWTHDGMLLCGNHASGSFHHSSFTSGKKVRCAGMIKFAAGKVTLVSNDSGHYHPGTRLLKNFAVHLKSIGVLHPDCLVMDCSQGRKELEI